MDYLLEEGFQSITVLDIAAEALAKSQQRLRSRESSSCNFNKVHWVVSDITQYVPERDSSFAVWHDRAVLHFLTRKEDQEAYVLALNRSLCVGGILIIATFAKGGPVKCSGLDIVQYDIDSMKALVGDRYMLLEEVEEVHITPFHTEQKFVYFKFVRVY